MSDHPLIGASGLTKRFTDGVSILDRLRGREGSTITAVDDVSLSIERGETVGLVGESGCGKSTTGQLLLGLQEPSAGTVAFDGRPIAAQTAAERRRFRQETAIVFQEPFSSLDPRMTVEEIICEPLVVNEIGTERERHNRARDLLERVELSAVMAPRYPHELSGGQCQRVAIARALALEPSFIVLDEPVSALDVSVQAQILSLLAELQDELELTYLFITHDLSVVSSLCDRVAVMYLGELVEVGPLERVFDAPAHPYTSALLESVPRARANERDRSIDHLAGALPSPSDPPSGCRFHTRCPKIIPPADLEIDQATYRAVFRLRSQIERGESVALDEFDCSDCTATVQQAIEEAIAALETGDRTKALDRLDATFESVCETTSPDEHTTPHRVSCHLHADADCRDHNCE
ncbi:ABC transporter ATP-binding protein [Halocatena halophila]|uniref:ABC transporter ATP-binding protein n=1 Tax=Halocatena halophila TaxID=2814576 RepID=UPI002ED68D68